MTNTINTLDKVAEAQMGAEYDMFSLAEQLNALEPSAGTALMHDAAPEITTFLDSAAIIFPAITAILMASAFIMGLTMIMRDDMR